MAKFDDYHRTVIGYHGTGLTAALRIVNRVDKFISSERDFDWLGGGIYFWEYSPRQALAWSKLRQNQYRKKKNKTPEDERRATEPLAVVACMIRLGFCLDLTEPENVKYMQDVYTDYKESLELASNPLPTNERHFRRLDCAVFNYTYNVLEASEPNRKVDSSRGIYVPQGVKKRIWEGSWISQDTHIQICVRNPLRLLGVWLHDPTSLEVNDVCKALQAGGVVIDSAYPQGEEVSTEAAEGKTN